MHDPDHLFRNTVAGVTPLHNQDSRKITNTLSNNRMSPEVTPITDFGRVELEGDLFYRSGIRKKRLRELRRGRLKIVDILDLHGYTRISTPTAITNFIVSCRPLDNQCVLIITGRGRNSPDRLSIVRATALETLQNNPRVLAYSCSQPVDGGQGAFYVLLQH